MDSRNPFVRGVHQMLHVLVRYCFEAVNSNNNAKIPTNNPSFGTAGESD